MSDRACKAEPGRHTLAEHLRHHGRATPAHVWAFRCRWCRLGDRWFKLRHPHYFDGLLDDRPMSPKVRAHARKLAEEHGYDGLSSSPGGGGLASGNPSPPPPGSDGSEAPGG